jgi:hypothetical protein
MLRSPWLTGRKMPTLQEERVVYLRLGNPRVAWHRTYQRNGRHGASLTWLNLNCHIVPYGVQLKMPDLTGPHLYVRTPCPREARKVLTTNCRAHVVVKIRLHHLPTSHSHRMSQGPPHQPSPSCQQHLCRSVRLGLPKCGGAKQTRRARPQISTPTSHPSSRTDRTGRDPNCSNTLAETALAEIAGGGFLLVPNRTCAPHGNGARMTGDHFSTTGISF